MLSSDAPPVTYFTGAAGTAVSHHVATASLPGFGRLLAWWTVSVFGAEPPDTFQLCAVRVEYDDVGVSGNAIVVAQVDEQVEADMKAIGAEAGYGTALLSVRSLGECSDDQAVWVCRQLARVCARCEWAMPTEWPSGRHRWGELVGILRAMADSPNEHPVSTTG